MRRTIRPRHASVLTRGYELYRKLREGAIKALTRGVRGYGNQRESGVAYGVREGGRGEQQAEQGASTARAGAEPNPYLRGIEQRPELYNEVSAIFAKYFDMYGEEEEVVEAAAG